MGLPLYLAKTHREMLEAEGPLSAYMACHFSPYGDGLEVPEALPECSMVILNDRVPAGFHDPEKVAGQLREFMDKTGADCILLDLQRPGFPHGLLKALTALPFPAAVTEQYAALCDGAVFLEVPMHRPLSDALELWKGRSLWLDVAGNTQRITVTKEGSRFSSLPRQLPEGTVHRDEKLHCSYTLRVTEACAEFTLFRTREDTQALLQEAEQLGFAKAIGLYQELG